MLLPKPGSTILRRWSSTLTAHLGRYRPRTHKCNELNESTIDSRVDLCGWLVNNRKVSKNLGFFVLQDAHGQVQLLARQSKASGNTEASGTVNVSTPNVLALLDSAPLQSVLQISGVVRRRLPSAITPGPTGAIEVAVDSVQILNPAKEKLPFSPNDEAALPAEEFRLRHRHLDLRRTKLSDNLRRRSEVAHNVRNFLHEQGFVEVETPMLLKSTPEGAREYLVPTRISKRTSSSEADASGQPAFYALSQSPQQPKQILISSGAVEKYFQFARCFRDEDGRADRQPEFTQIDLEMAWVSWGSSNNDAAATPTAPFSNWRIGGGEVRNVIEGIMRKIWAQDLEFPVMQYMHAMEYYGSDKPDLRWDKKLLDITYLLPAEARDHLSAAGTAVEALVIPASELDGRWDMLEQYRSPTVEIHKLEPGVDWKGGSQLFPQPTDGQGIQIPGTENGAALLIATRPIAAQGGWTSLGRVRAGLTPHFAPDPQAQKFLWVTEFPLFTRADEDKDFLAHGRWSSSHHPFTAPMVEDLPLLQQGGSALAKIRGQHYDLVLNGTEVAGGSVRVHDATLQEHIFENVLELTPNERAGFSELLEALRSGAPPHAGIAIGFDRLMAILCGERSIRNVVAFPKTAGGADLLFKSPTPVPAQTLELYGLRGM
ncbi:hypothetical protein M408DRAFT_19917 [Serendipita vermifera MAFF 305830]|uniref:Aminoacyl-transfer RNA synthetases class-II family profile domain-containing protein n=1 Tax=Serendipita vermifera MAFF 305830 TaxID=933852 RepID=A0A0C3BNL6_SERVB|nr:hypothetical protein M408DRAFT_19917 [Serendipita vermifera MAFF 305830]